MSHILVCDDLPANLDLLTDLLTTSGYKVSTYLVPEQALEACEENKPDLLLLDIALPRMDGFELLRRIRQIDGMSDKPVIFLSAHHDMENRIKGFDLGAADFIPKPFNIREITARIKTHLKMAEKPKMLAQQVQDAEMAIYTATHDLRNPMSNIDMAATILTDSLQERGDLTDTEQYCFEMIQKASQKMHSMIDDVLSFAELQNMRRIDRKDVVIADLLKASYEQYMLTAKEKSIGLTYEFDGDESRSALLESISMRRMVDNLLSNAIKYTPVDGKVSLCVTINDTQLEIIVQDTGIGIPEDMLDKVFNQFVRVDDPEHRKEKGTGLGLSVVKRVVDLHEGTVTVASTVGEGTRFTVIFPIAS